MRRSATLAIILALTAGTGAYACTYCTSSLPGFKRGPGRVMYPGTPQTMPPPPGYVLAPGPEFTGDYSIKYLYSHRTEQAYSDPLYYKAQGALTRWHAIQAREKEGTRRTVSKSYQTEK